MLDKYLLLGTLHRIKVNITEQLEAVHRKDIAESLGNVFSVFSSVLEEEILSGKYDVKESKDAR